MDVRLPDGTVVRNVPDNMSQADLTAKLIANGYDANKLKPPAPTESGGFFGTATEALKERVNTFLPSAKLFTGLGDQKAATDELLRQKEASANKYKPTEFGEIGAALKEGEFGTALGKTAEKTKEVAGASIGSMLPAMAAGAAASKFAPGALKVPAAVAGTAVYGLTALGSYISDNISRQKEEQEKTGDKYADVNRTKAALAGAGQTGLDLLGYKIFKPLGRLVGIEGKETAEKAALEIVQAATKPHAYKLAVAKGTASGIAFEIPQEVTQTVLERWQAGLAIDPFGDPAAAKEYLEAAGGALLLGGPMGAASRVAQTYTAQQSPEGQALTRTDKPEWVSRDLEGEGNARAPIVEPSGEGTTMAPSSADGDASGRATDAGRSGLASTQSGMGVSTDGTADELNALTSAGAAVTSSVPVEPFKGAAPLPPKIDQEDFTKGLIDFRNTYEDIKRELATPGLPKEDADWLQSDLGRLVENNKNLINNDRKLINRLKNPMVDGLSIIDNLLTMSAPPVQGNVFDQAPPPDAEDLTAPAPSEPKAMRMPEQKDLFTGEISSEPELTPRSETRNERIKKDFSPTKNIFSGFGVDSEDTVNKSVEPTPPLTLRRGETEEDRRWREFHSQDISDINLDETGEPTTSNEEKTKIKAPQVDTEHIKNTEEGRLIGSFFDAIAPETATAGEIAKHTAVKNVAKNSMLEMDIATAPGEEATLAERTSGRTNEQFTAQPLQNVLQYIATSLGGMDNFKTLVEDLKNADVATQKKLFAANDLPDLTTRRGMEKFNTQVQQSLEDIAYKGEGYTIPTGNAEALEEGEYYEGVIPYKDKIKVDVRKTHVPKHEAGKKPRRPGTNAASETKTYEIADRDLRYAWGQVTQAIRGGYASAKTIAAKNYITNHRRESFGQTLNDLAYDIAGFELEPQEYGANWLFTGEGGKYALDFKAWIDANLHQSTKDTLNNLINDYKQNIIEANKFDAAVTEYEQRKKEYSESRIAAAEKATGVKIPRAPKNVSKIIRSTERVSNESIPEAPSNRGMMNKIDPNILRILKSNDLSGALKTIADKSGSPYVAELANRLLETNVTANVEFVKADDIVFLRTRPEVKETLGVQLTALKEIIRTGIPEAKQDALLKSLDSKKLSELKSVIRELASEFRNDISHLQVVSEANDLIRNELDWSGKYDPNTDTITLREGASLTNHVFLHEVVHTATAQLIDNADSLTGARKEAYDRLVELYNHSKPILKTLGSFNRHSYALSDLHEFISEALTNPDFQADLQAIRYKSSPKSLWTVFTDIVSKMFGMKGDKSNVLVEVMRATDIFMPGEMTSAIDQMGPSTKNISTPKGLSLTTPEGLSNLMTAKKWSQVKSTLSDSSYFASFKTSVRPVVLGTLTTRQIDDLVAGRIPQISNFLRVTDEFLARKSRILQESGKITDTWRNMQQGNPELSRDLARVMHAATVSGIDPDIATPFQLKDHPELATAWKKLDPKAKQIYREARDFFEKRYNEYKKTIQMRLAPMIKYGVSENTILKIREEFEKNKRKGPYFPLMRHGRFWYQVGSGKTREFYMFESQREKEAHIAEQFKQRPGLKNAEFKEGSQYREQMDLHARQSEFLKSAFLAIDNANFNGMPTEIEQQRQELKDSLYQNFLANQPEHSFRTQFMHRNNVAGYSEDALRNFASSSFHMAYQLARFEYMPELFSQLDAARQTIKGRIDADTGYSVKLSRENTELEAYVKEASEKLKLILNPPDAGVVITAVSNAGFIWYLSAPASAITNVLGGLMLSLPVLVGQIVKTNPGMSYTRATFKALSEMKKVIGQVMATGIDVKSSKQILENRLLLPSLDRAKGLSKIDRAAYEQFVAEGLIDITSTYDQSGLASSPTEQYGGGWHNVMKVITYLFHNTERFNREIIAMSTFRTAMENRKNYADKELAFQESVREAKDLTIRAAFDYSSANKPRYVQNKLGRLVWQFKQFPQQLTFFLVHNFVKSLGVKPDNFAKMSKAEQQKFYDLQREAKARFYGTMGMAGIFSGATGMWGFSTVASIIEAVVNGTKDDDDDEIFSFELWFVQWAIETFGTNIGTLITRGIGNAAGVDLHSRLKHDGMWFQDPRKNNDQIDAWKSRLVDLLGPVIGLSVNVIEAGKLYNEGHTARAIEKIVPAFVKNPMVAKRYADEGVVTLKGEELLDRELSPFELLMQSLGIRPAEVAERQFINIKVKGEEQDILKERQSLLDLYALYFMTNNADGVDEAEEKIDKFNAKHPYKPISMKTIKASIKNRLKKSSETDHGLYLDKALRATLGGYADIDLDGED